MCDTHQSMCVRLHGPRMVPRQLYTHPHTCPCRTVFSVQLFHTLHTNCVCAVHIFSGPPLPSPVLLSMILIIGAGPHTHTHTLLHLAREVRDEGHGKARLRIPPFSLGIHSTLLSVSLYFSGQVLSSRLKSTIRNESSLSLGHQRTHTHASLSWLLG